MFRSVRRKAGAIALAGLVAVALIACSGNSAPDGDPAAGSEGEPQKGGDIVATALNELPGFDPVRLTALGTGIERAAQIFDTLMYRDDLTDEVKPKLAESLKSEDGKVWVLTLRDGVTFTDGTPLDAAAVIFNLERHIAPDSISTAKSMLSDVQSMEATGEYEVTVTLSTPSGSFPLSLTGSSSASLIGSPKALANPEEFNEHPVGAGPFMLDSWTRDSELKLVRNDDYFVKGQPYVDSVTYKVLPDAQARVDSVTSGGVQLAAQVPGSAWATLEGNQAVKVLRSPTGGAALIPNASEGHAGADERVRQAIGLAIDPKVTNSVVFPGSSLWDGNRDCIPFPQDSDACLKGSSPKPDVDKAKRLIEEFVADGGDPKVDFIAPGTSDEITFYQSQLEAIGLDVNLKVSDAGAWLADMATGKYDITYGTIGSAGYPTEWRYMFPEGYNWGQVAYDDLTDALLRARDELKLEDRNKAWRDVAQIDKDRSILFWQAPFTTATVISSTLHLGSDEFPYRSTLMVYFGDAWLDK